MNILFLLADQLNPRAISVYGGRHVATPNIDGLARDGVMFANAYCTWPVCSPSRASIVTGQYPHTHGITRNADTPELPAVTNETVTCDRILAANGYATFHFGRWHVGDRRNLDYYRGRLETRTRTEYHKRQLAEDIRLLRQRQPPAFLADKGQYAAMPHLKKGMATAQETVEFTPAAMAAHQRWQNSDKAVYPILSVIGRSIIPAEHRPTSLMTDHVIETLRRAGPNPFAIAWSIIEPHDPVAIPEPYYSMVPRDETLLPANACGDPGEWGGVSRDFFEIIGMEAALEYIAVYMGMVKYIDDQVGRILDALGETGLANDTLVVFAADHGDTLGAHGMLAKSSPGFWEETTKVPLLMRPPSSVARGRRITAPVSLVDLAPTFLDFAGLEPPAGIAGASLRPLMRGDTEAPPHPVLCEMNGFRMVRVGEWKYAWYAPGREWLFDLAADPGETRNLIAGPEHAARAAQMRGIMRAELERTGGV